MAKGVAKRTKEQIRKSSTKQLEAEGQLASRPFCTSQTNSVKKILKGKSQSRKKKHVNFLGIFKGYRILVSPFRIFWLDAFPLVFLGE